MKVKVDKAFSFAHGGVRVVRYNVGEQEMPDDAAEHAIAEKLGTVVKETKAKGPSPENK